MSPGHHRHERVGEEIAHEINAMLAGELKDPRLEGFVCVSEVRVQPDMKHASGRKAQRKGPTLSGRWSTPPDSSAMNSLNACSCAGCRICTSRWTFPRNASSASSNC